MQRRGSALPKLFGIQPIVQKVDEIAGSFSLDAPLRDIRTDPARDKSAGFFRILFEVGKALSTAATLDDMLHTAVKLVFEVVHGERVVILLQPPDGGEPAPRLAWHRARGAVPPQEIPISRTIASQVVSEKVSIITSDALHDPRFMQGISIALYNIRSALCVPLWVGQEIYGAIYLDNLAKSYAFTQDDLELMTAIANLVAIRIKQEETAARLRREEILRANLAKYHSPDVVNMLMTRGGDVGLEVTEREVSVVFIDVVSSTRLAEILTAKQVAALLNEFFLMATNAVFAHKGHVNKFIGDEVMAIFNAPVDMADHARAAVRACATLLAELKTFNAEHADRAFNVRCAVNSGAAVAGNVGTPTRMEYTVLGDTVNVAARLSKFPQENSIVIGERTRELIGDEFRVRDLGESVVKGKEKSLRVFEVLVP
jgi:adenylate cyclase